MQRNSPRTYQVPPGTDGTQFQTAYDRGLRCIGERRFDAAIGLLSDALKFKPRDVAALSNLGLAFGAVGRLDEALAAYDRAVAATPGVASLHFNRGNGLASMGRFEEAVLAYDDALALKATFTEALTNRGNALRQLGRNDEALANYDRALKVNPRLFEALFSKATLLDETGDPLAALAALDKALAADKTSARGFLMRADIKKRLGKSEAALADFTLATRADPRNAVAHTLRGDQLAELGRSVDALKAFEKATEIDPGFADAQDRLGCALVEIGRIEEARHAHEKAVALAPRKSGFYFNLSAVKEFGAEDAHFLAMKRMAEDAKSLPSQDEIPLRFALFKAYSDQRNFKAAFRQLVRGNVLKRAQIDYDESAALLDMKQSAAIFTVKLLAECRGRGDASKAPIFIVGMPRSGSTLVEQILASHPKVHGAGEVSDFVAAAVEIGGENLRDLRADDNTEGAFDEQLRRIGATYVKRIQTRAGSAERIVNKMLDNFRFLGLIHLALPNARILHVRRDPLDTCLSCYSKLFSQTLPYAYDLAELGRYYRSYDALMAHWRAIVPAETLLEIQYEELVADPEANGRRIVEHCGLEWDSRCLDFHRTIRPVRTASAVQVRKPLYTHSVARWRDFAEDLAPLIAALGPSAPNPIARLGRSRNILRRWLEIGRGRA